MISKKTLVCGAVTMAFASISMAQSFPEEMPEKFDEEVFRTEYPPVEGTPGSLGSSGHTT